MTTAVFAVSLEHPSPPIRMTEKILSHVVCVCVCVCVCHFSAGMCPFCAARTPSPSRTHGRRGRRTCGTMLFNLCLCQHHLLLHFLHSRHNGVAHVRAVSRPQRRVRNSCQVRHRVKRHVGRGRGSGSVRHTDGAGWPVNRCARLSGVCGGVPRRNAWRHHGGGAVAAPAGR